MLAPGRRDGADDDRHADPAHPGRRWHLHAAGHGHADRHGRRRRLAAWTRSSTASTAATGQDLHRAGHAPAAGRRTRSSSGRRTAPATSRRLKSVAFTIAVSENCPTNLNDEFDGPTLDPKWTILRGTPRRARSSTGALQLQVRNGDMIGARPRPRTCCSRTRRRAGGRRRRKLDVSTLTTAGEQAGFILWQGENPNTFAKITYISKGTPAVRVGLDAQQRPDIHGRPADRRAADGRLPAAQRQRVRHLHRRRLDRRRDLQQIAGAITELGDPETMKVGMKVSNTQDNAHYAGVRLLPRGLLGQDRAAPRRRSAPRSRRQARLVQDVAEASRWRPTTASATASTRSPTGSTAARSRPMSGSRSRPPATVSTWSRTSPPTRPATSRRSRRRRSASTARRPKTRPRSTLADQETGPATVTLDPPTATSGSGTVLTEYRVDGGPWTDLHGQGRAASSTASAASLAPVEAGGRRAASTLMTDGSGGITPVGGLGMLWYPGRSTGTTSSSSSSARAGRTVTHSNGGVFMRFPNPEQTPRTDACAKSAAPRPTPAWVAIYCGHEIQLYDGEPGRAAQDRLGLQVRQQHHRPDRQRRSRRRVGGLRDRGASARHFTIFRNGEVINEFDNTPGQQTSDRAGDPPTEPAPVHARLHRPAEPRRRGHDAVPQRPHRGPLAGRATPVTAAKPFPVTGKGPHTVEVRSMDAAGNVEEKLVLSVRDRDGHGAAARDAAAAGPGVDEPADAADDRHAGDLPARHGALEAERRVAEQARPEGAGAVHGRDDRLGEAHDVQQGRQAR